MDAALTLRVVSCFPDAVFVVLAGRLYRGAVAGLNVEIPLAGLGIGQQIAWLKRETERLNSRCEDCCNYPECDRGRCALHTPQLPLSGSCR